MNQFLVPLIFAIAILIFVLGLVFAVKDVKRKWGLRHAGSSMIKMPYSERTGKRAKEIICSFEFPVALDLVVEHLGKKPEIYMVVEKKYFPKLKRLAEKIAAEEHEVREDDYLIFHHGGFNEIFSGEMEKEEIMRMDFGAIDFSMINEIGEGAAIRMIFAPKRKAKISMFFSAPSRFQLREIMEGAIQPFKGKGLRTSKNREAAMAEFNSPNFLCRAEK